MNYFDDRALHGVSIGGISIQKGDGELSIATSVSIDLAAKDDPTLAGPGLQMGFAIDMTAETSLVSMQNAAFDRAMQLLRRAASFSDEELRAAFERNETYILQQP